jgi:hypothetical protein
MDTVIVFTANQLVAHAIGDYVIQSDWMAHEKRARPLVALVHALSYSLPFLVLTDASWWAMLVIVLSHAVIDHFGLARYVCWTKNVLAPKWINRTKLSGDLSIRSYDVIEVASRNYPWSECAATGYHESRPPWLATWLMIITDNVMHVLCNAAAIQWL